MSPFLVCAQYLVPGVCSLHTKAFFLPVDIQHTFFLFFFFFLRFSLSFLLFSVFSFLVPFSFVLSFRLIVFRLLLVSPSSLLFSLPCFPYWRILLFCYFASALHSPRPPCESEVCVFPLRTVFFLALLMLTYLQSYFHLFLTLSDFDLDIVCFILSFSCGYYAVSSVSVSAATRLAYDIIYRQCILIRTHADLTFLYFCLRYVYDLFQLLRVLSSVLFVFLLR